MTFSSQAYKDVKIVLIMYLFVLTSRKKTLVAFFHRVDRQRLRTEMHRFRLKGIARIPHWIAQF